MNPHDLRQWFLDHRSWCMDLVRIYLGVGLFAKGLAFLVHREELVRTMVEHDIIWSGMAKTQERIQGGGIEYTDPYFLIFDRILVLKDSPIKGVDDLKGKTLASTLGTMDSIVAHSLVENGKAAKVLDFNTFGEPFLALRNKQADAVILDETLYLGQKGDMPDLRMVGEPLFYIPKKEWAEASTRLP